MFDIALKEFDKYASLMLVSKPKLKLCIKSGFDEGRRNISASKTEVAITAGSRIALLYGVYDYFAYHGAKWFWDGDRLPQNAVEPKEFKKDITPAYALRGMRYFAHRGLKRFRTEMWGFEDWKREFDYLIKNGFNFFMLRIGQDDLWQKAFPEYCPYPDIAQKSDKDGFYDRSLFWSLEYRGELRRKVLAYAKERGLKYAVDCGAVTHWYSPTPKSFADNARPPYLAQSGELYAQKELLAFDVRKEEGLDIYQKLTDADVKYNGMGDMFHTIGLAERVYGDTHQQSIALKADVLRRTLRAINDKYPFAKTLIAGWDMSMFWHPDEVKTFVGTLDAEKCIIFDYTVDCGGNDKGFEAWGLKNKFPYIPGLIHAYAPQDDIRGDYEFIERRLKGTPNDGFCRGLVAWQELSHGDGVMLSYLAHKCTYGEDMSVDEILMRYADEMFCGDFEAKRLVKMLYPIASLEKFSLDRQHPEYDMHRQYFVSVMTSPYGYNLDFDQYTAKEISRAEFYLPKFYKVMHAIPEVLSLCAELYMRFKDDAHAVRALYDIARTAAARFMHFEMLVLQKVYFCGGDCPALYESIYRALEYYTELLGTHDDYIAYKTLEDIKRESFVNPYFETAFKKNIASDYCIGNCYETLKAISLPQMKLLGRKLCGEHLPQNAVSDIYDLFFDTPLEAYSTKTDKILSDFAQICKNICAVSKLAIDFNDKLL